MQLAGGCAKKKQRKEAVGSPPSGIGRAGTGRAKRQAARYGSVGNVSRPILTVRCDSQRTGQSSRGRRRRSRVRSLPPRDCERRQAGDAARAAYTSTAAAVAAAFLRRGAAGGEHLTCVYGASRCEEGSHSPEPYRGADQRAQNRTGTVGAGSVIQGTHTRTTTTTSTGDDDLRRPFRHIVFPHPAPCCRRWLGRDAAAAAAMLGGFAGRWLLLCCSPLLRAADVVAAAAARCPSLPPPRQQRATPGGAARQVAGALPPAAPSVGARRKRSRHVSRSRGRQHRTAVSSQWIRTVSRRPTFGGRWHRGTRRWVGTRALPSRTRRQQPCVRRCHAPAPTWMCRVARKWPRLLLS